MAYSIGEFVVCPGHGVGQICDLEEKNVGGQIKTVFVIRILSTPQIKIYIYQEEQNKGMRKLASVDEISKVFDLLNTHDVKVDTSTYNRRQRTYLEKINSGSLIEIADVLRSLFLLKQKFNKDLSFNERRLVEQCKGLLVKEIALSQGHDEAQVSSQIEACFQ